MFSDTNTVSLLHVISPNFTIDNFHDRFVISGTIELNGLETHVHSL